MNKEAIENLPIRNVSELYNLQSGVVRVQSRSTGIPDHEERGLQEVHVRGGRSGEIAYMIDGMYIRNPIMVVSGMEPGLINLQYRNLIGSQVALMQNMEMQCQLFRISIQCQEEMIILLDLVTIPVCLVKH